MVYKAPHLFFWEVLQDNQTLVFMDLRPFLSKLGTMKIITKDYFGERCLNSDFDLAGCGILQI